MMMKILTVIMLSSSALAVRDAVRDVDFDAVNVTLAEQCIDFNWNKYNINNKVDVVSGRCSGRDGPNTCPFWGGCPANSDGTCPANCEAFSEAADLTAMQKVHRFVSRAPCTCAYKESYMFDPSRIAGFLATTVAVLEDKMEKLDGCFSTTAVLFSTGCGARVKKIVKLLGIVYGASSRAGAAARSGKVEECTRQFPPALGYRADKSVQKLLSMMPEDAKAKAFAPAAKVFSDGKVGEEADIPKLLTEIGKESFCADIHKISQRVPPLSVADEITGLSKLGVTGDAAAEIVSQTAAQAAIDPISLMVKSVTEEGDNGEVTGGSLMETSGKNVFERVGDVVYFLVAMIVTAVVGSIFAAVSTVLCWVTIGEFAPTYRVHEALTEGNARWAWLITCPFGVIPDAYKVMWQCFYGDNYGC